MLILAKSPFFRTGFNGLIEDGINERLKKQYPGKRAAYLWNEISKLSTTEGISRKVSSHIHEYERKYFHVIPKEIELLKPDVVIFLTGFKDPYDSYIHENFNVEASLSVGNISTNDVIKLKLQGIPLAYKTHHPGANKVTGHIHFLDKKGIHYNAISDDIAANFKNDMAANLIKDTSGSQRPCQIQQGLTLEELNEQWESCYLYDDRPIVRKTWWEHRQQIALQFGIDIGCDMLPTAILLSIETNWADLIFRMAARQFCCGLYSPTGQGFA